MFDALGVNWAGTLLGCVAALLVPIPIIFYKYGAKIRQRSKFAPTFPMKAPERGSESEGVSVQQN
jgi:DHA1 family multidrug resistance protein-like MFS transporter